MNSKETEKLVKLLSVIPAKGVSVSPSNRKDRDGEVVLIWPEGRFYAEACLLAIAARRGLVQRRAGRIWRSPDAAFFLKRFGKLTENAFADQHRDLEFASCEIDERVETVRVNISESPLAGLERLKGRDGKPFFPPEAIAAGERLCADFTRGQMQPRITMSFEPRLNASVKGARGGAAELSDSSVAARRRVGKAVEAMGPELSGVALDVCCFMKGLATVERERQWPARSAKLMLKTALLILHRHYFPTARKRSRHWGDDGFRPDISSSGSQGTLG